jgi:NTE family protein
MAMAAHPDRAEVGLVLAGGGARGAYELGALSELLPRLAEEERPRVIVGTSVGAVNAAYMAATADQPLAQALESGCDIWREMSWDSALSPLTSLAQLRIVLRSIADALGIPGARSWGMLDPAPLRETLEQKVPFRHIHDNVLADRIAAAAVVATRASTSLSVVFCDSEREPPPADDRRGIAYEKTAALSSDHVIASAAIPGAFPAVELKDPAAARDWYFDGGTRLNTPIRPALDLGAQRLVIVALHSPKLATVQKQGKRPQLLDGVAQLLQGVLVDPLLNDVQTLSTINSAVADAPGEGGDHDAGEKDAGEKAGFEPIPYILIAPTEPNAIGELATRVYRRRYEGKGNRRRRRQSVGRLGRLLDVGDAPLRGEMLSYLFFDEEFAEELIELGRRDARAWMSAEHDLGLWQLRPQG